MTDTADAIILGGGLAGLSTAKELLSRNLKVCLADPVGISSGASGVPIGLANYATGRHAKLSWEAGKCMDALIGNLNEVQSRSAVHFWRQNGVLRPALDEKIAEKTLENYKSTDWPESATARWLSSEELKALNPHVPSEFGAIWLEKACTVIPALYLQSMREMLLSKGLILVEENYELTENSGWYLSSSSDKKVQAPLLIDCTGQHTQTAGLTYQLKLHPIKGQLLLFRRQAPIPFNHSLSALGYIGHMDQKYFAVGSTYEHHFEDLSITEDGKERLMNKINQICPMLLEDAELVEHWSGIRASTPNRLPIAGKHPEHDRIYIFKGLGSKGLLFSAHISALLADHILDQIPLPEAIGIQRFS